MAFTPNTEHKSSRSDVFACDPFDVAVDWRKNVARGGVEPAVDEDLKQLAMSMRPKGIAGNGQIQPVMVRPLPDRTLELIGGFRRMRAARWLIESGECPDFKIQVIVRRLSDQEAAINNLIENLDRKDVTPLEQAHACRSLHEDYSLSMADVAARLGRSEAWLTRIMLLCTLPERIQQSIAKGETTVSAAIEIARAPNGNQVKIFDAARDSKGKVSAAEVREKRRESGEDVAPTQRSIRHIKTILEELGGPGETRKCKQLVKALTGFIEGRIEDIKLIDTWRKVTED